MGNSINLIELSVEDLKNLFCQVIKTELRVIKKDLKPKEPNSFLTRKEVAEMLKIDLSTVHNWRKKGLLKPHQIGNRVYYKLNEIESAIVELKRDTNE